MAIIGCVAVAIVVAAMVAVMLMRRGSGTE